MKAILGSWGIGGFIKGKNPEVSISHGIFGNQSFLTSKQIKDRVYSDPYQIYLPPLSKFSKGGIDYLPFLLYEKVIMDSGCFDTICNKFEIIPPKIAEYIGPNTRLILDKLHNKGILELADYRQILEKEECDDHIDKMIKYDLEDPNILKPIKRSLEHWIDFYQTLLDSCSPEDTASILKCIEKFNSFSAQLNDNRITDYEGLFKYAFECTSDINRLLYISSTNFNDESCIYDWEDYFYFYDYKFSRAGKNLDPRSIEEGFYKLMYLFVPEFKILSFDHLLEIRENPKLAAIRDYIKAKDPADFTEDTLRSVLYAILKIDNKIEKYRKIGKFLLKPIGFIPFVGSLIEMAAEEAGERIIKKKVGSDYQWQCFLTDMKRLYDKHQIIDFACNIKQLTNRST